MLRAFLVVFLVASLAFFAVCVYGALLDWRELQASDAAFRAAIPRADLKTLFVLEARQNVHRVNLFADVVWALLCALGSVICALGLRFERRTRSLFFGHRLTFASGAHKIGHAAFFGGDTFDNGVGHAGIMLELRLLAVDFKDLSRTVVNQITRARFARFLRIGRDVPRQAKRIVFGMSRKRFGQNRKNRVRRVAF